MLGVRLYDGLDLNYMYIQFSWLGPELLVSCLAHRGSTGTFRLVQIFSKLLGAQGSQSPGSFLNL